MSRSTTRAERLLEMERLYLQGAYSDSEMARRLGVDRTTVYRDRMELARHVPFIEESPGKWRIDRRIYLSQIRVNAVEALVLYLASRREAQRIRGGYPAMASALEKLATTLQRPMMERLVRAADNILSQQRDERREKVFETIAHAWVDQVRVRVRYQGLETRRPYWDTLNPYLIEPSPWSDSVYVIGLSQVFADIATYRVDRCLEAHLTDERFTIPEDFDEDALLRYTWGIWRGEGTPTWVVLKFSAGPAAKRVQESKWHPLQEIEVLEDGSCIWRAPIAEWREMLPWIRGWGADIEVLAPDALRSALRREVRRLTRIYLAEELQHRPLHYLLWAKARQEQGAIHPLVYHLIDVGQVALYLWRHVIPLRERTYLARMLGLSEEACGRFFAFLAACHDIGKASPAFQRKYEDYALRELQPRGLLFPPHMQDARHGTISTKILQALLEDRLGISRHHARRLAHAVGGHHGLWPHSRYVQNIASEAAGSGTWQRVQEALFNDMCSVFQPPRDVQFPSSTSEFNTVLTWLSGLTTVADWLGSMEEFFEFEDRLLKPADYAREAERKAHRALEETGWLWWRPKGAVLTFEEMFPDFSPNDIQAAVIEATRDLPHPALVLLEAPTGSGKTEIAFYLADRWLQGQGGRGLYIGMPTQATSNQMMDRVRDFLARRYPQDVLNLHLVHGNARWTRQMATVRVASVGETPEDHVTAAAWFLPRKRTLLAPFAVGTVDQTLMSVLQTRHFFLRLFGLANKVVIFDEVHAYDTYMERIFLRLLHWLRWMGTSVIILSATLPQRTRERLVAAYLGEEAIGQENQADSASPPYPRLIIASTAGVQTLPLPAPEDRCVRLTYIPRRTRAIVDALRITLRDGGCTAVICNTVHDAQEMYMALKEASLVPDHNLLLFHARMPFAWRKEVEERVLNLFGKDGDRPHKAIVVATQVIEQSLDLDFDIIITDLAPIDLLIQRAGRLHRHPRPTRPKGLEEPQLVILRPEGTLEHPDFGRSIYVYEPYILWQTWRVLHNERYLRLPSATTRLIEAVYGEPETLPPGLAEAYEAMMERLTDMEYKATQRLVPPPTEERLVIRPLQDLKDDEDPTIHEEVRALTRLIEPGVNLVCLHRVEGELYTEPNGKKGKGVRVDLNEYPTGKILRSLLEHVVTVHRRAIVQHFAQHAVPDAWREVPALRYCYPAIFENGICRLEGTPYALTLDRELGLRIDKEEAKA